MQHYDPKWKTPGKVMFLLHQNKGFSHTIIVANCLIGEFIVVYFMIVTTALINYRLGDNDSSFDKVYDRIHQTTLLCLVSYDRQDMTGRARPGATDDGAAV